MKNTALTDTHIALGAKMAEFAGYNMPISYSGINQEHLPIRKSIGVFDVSHMGEFMLKGENALALIQQLTTNDASKRTDGKVQYSCLTNDEGGIVDDLLVHRFFCATQTSTSLREQPAKICKRIAVDSGFILTTLMILTIFFTGFGLSRSKDRSRHTRRGIRFSFKIIRRPFQLSHEFQSGFAERFEVYWRGLELCNAFHELNDPRENRMRFERDLAEKRRLGKESVPLDEELLKAFESGMPPSGGIALGLERLYMAVHDITDIGQVAAFSAMV